jgi:hypothetical protein
MRNVIAICVICLIATNSTGRTGKTGVHLDNTCLDEGISKIIYQIKKRSLREPESYELTNISQGKNQRTIKLTVYMKNHGSSWLTAKVNIHNSNCCKSQWTITQRSKSLGQTFSVNERFKFSCQDNYKTRKIRPGRPYPRGQRQRRNSH